MEKLIKFLEKNRVQQATLAAALNVHPSTVSRVLSGKIADPPISFVLAVEQYTGGKVKPKDWKQ